MIVAVFAKWIAPHNPLTQYNNGLTAEGSRSARAASFWLGTDTARTRPAFSRIIYGARVSLVIGICANGFALVLGVIFGIVRRLLPRLGGDANHARHRRDDGVPDLPLRHGSHLGRSAPGIWILVVVIAIVYWTPMTRVIHGEVL